MLAKGLKKEQVGVTIEAERLRVVTIGADGEGLGWCQAGVANAWYSTVCWCWCCCCCLVLPVGLLSVRLRAASQAVPPHT